MADRYFNRELSWLQFNRRVLELATSPDVPLLERVRFLSIYSSNQDEFFMKRVGYLKNIVEEGVSAVGTDQMDPSTLLVNIKREVIQANAEIDRCYRQDIIPALREQKIFLLSWEELSKSEAKQAADYFKSNVFPVLTPLAVDPAHPFPFLSNLSISFGVKLHYPKDRHGLFARIKIPEMLPQWVRLGNDRNEYRFVRLEDLIRHNIKGLFPEMKVQQIMTFRVTRSAEMGQLDDEADDLLSYIEEGLRQRKMGQVIRLEYSELDADVRDMIKKELELDDTDFYQTTGELDYTFLNQIVSLNLPHLKYPSWTPLHPVQFPEDTQDIFRAISERDLLVHHPYESFSGSVEKFLRAAVIDPHVLAIKITIYRAGESSSLIPLLIKAAEAGKQVVCVIEVKARFDEARNIYWAEQLERAGAHVTYGIVGLKTHAKMMLVVRREAHGFRFFTHFGTGNYNAETSKLYTDIGLFTSDPKVCSEVIETFNYLTGLSLKKNYEHLLLAPLNMRQRFLDYIEAEIVNAAHGKPTGIIAKMNSLEDQHIIEALYRASQAGVRIELLVRGFCCLVPGLPGLSENIRVRSILGRFLEHSRLFYFRAGAETPEGGELLMGSADWMYRNLNSRVEVVVPIREVSHKKWCLELLQIYLQDNCQSWVLGTDGTYKLQSPRKNQERHSTMEQLMAHYRELSFRRS